MIQDCRYFIIVVSAGQAAYFLLAPLHQWLEQDFIGYLDEWEQSVQTCTDCTCTQKTQMCLSREMLEGWQTTGKEITLQSTYNVMV